MENERSRFLQYINDVNHCTGKGSKIKPLTHEQTLEIAENIQASIKIIENSNEYFDFRVINEPVFKKNLDLLIKHNLLYVVREAKAMEDYGLATLNDLIQEGNIGLYRAALRFDPGRGMKFLTFARWWIRQGMFSFMSEHSRTVQLPANITNALNKINKASQILYNRFGYVDPVVLQFGTQYSFKDDNGNVVTIKESEDFIEGCDLHPLEVLKIQNAAARGTSINAPTSSDDEASTMEDVLFKVDDEERKEEQTEASILISYALSKLDERDREIMKDRYGIDREYSMEPDQIAKNREMTSSAINYIIRRCIIEMNASVQEFKMREDPVNVMKKLKLLI